MWESQKLPPDWEEIRSLRSKGEVLAMGSPREVQTDPAVVEAYLGSIDDVSSLRRQPAREVA